MDAAAEEVIAAARSPYAIFVMEKEPGIEGAERGTREWWWWLLARFALLFVARTIAS